MRYSKQIQWVTASAAIATLGLWLGTDHDRGSHADVPAAVVAMAAAPAGNAAAATTAPIGSVAPDAGRSAPAAGAAYSASFDYDMAAALPPAANGRDAPLQIQQQQDAGPQPKDERLSTRVAALARSASPRPMELVVRFDATPTDATHRAIRAAGGQIVRSYEKLPLRAVRIPAQKITALADVPGVKFIEVNAPVASASTAAIAAARVPVPGNFDYVAPSSAIGVAIVDSGIAAHPDLNVASRVVLADARWTMWNSYVDYFWNTASWSGSDGTDPWHDSPWTELGDDGNAATGRVTVERDYCPDWNSICAEIDTVAVGTGIERALDLGGATEAWLGFGFRLHNRSESVAVVLELSSDGGKTWSTPLSTAADNVDGYYWYDVTPWASADTRMRFRVTDADSRAVFTSTTSRSGTRRRRRLATSSTPHRSTTATAPTAGPAAGPRAATTTRRRVVRSRCARTIARIRPAAASS
ncbi:MAG: hypothetical protein R3E65_03000 [Steroidobacteraceae bacterium]